MNNSALAQAIKEDIAGIVIVEEGLVTRLLANFVQVL